MQLIGRLDPGLGANSFDTGPAARGGKVILHNLSPYDLILTFNYDLTRQAILAAWQPREFDFCGTFTNIISYDHLQAGTAALNPQATPSTLVIGEAYAEGEPVPKSHPNYDRLSNVGNTTMPAQFTQSVSNTNNPSYSPFIDSTPAGWPQPAVDLTNDGSGNWVVFSNGLYRTFLSIIQGTATSEAQVAIGDANDPAAFVFHGTADNATQAGQAQTAVSAIQARQITCYDGGLGTVRQVTEYEGATDPTTYATPNEGDRWYAG